jgi:hypothetical protein
MNFDHCVKCDARSCGGRTRPKCTGVMLCTLNGKDILENSAAGVCPKGLFSTPDEPIQPRPSKPRTFLPLHPDNWPAWAKLVAAMKAPEDKGVGSTIDRKLGLIGAAFKLTLKALGVPCGCGERKELYDKLYSYSRE